MSKGNRNRERNRGIPKTPNSQVIKKIRSRMLKWQDNRCFYCGNTIRDKHNEVTSQNETTIDHLFPRSSGYHVRSNAVASCATCNNHTHGKGNRFPTVCETFRAEVLYEINGWTLGPTHVFDTDPYKIFHQVDGLKRFSNAR